MSKALKQRVQQLLKQGFDINQATSVAMGNPPDGPPKPPSPPTPPLPIKPATPPQTLGEKDGGSRLKINKKAKRARKGSGQGTGTLRINLNATPTAASSGGVNVGGG